MHGWFPKSSRRIVFFTLAFLVCVGVALFFIAPRFLQRNDRITSHPSKLGLPTTPDATDLIYRRFEVIFDQSNEQVYSPFDVGFTGMSEWAREVQNQGGGVSLNSLPLPERLDALAGPHQVLVLGVALERRYPPADLEAIDRFLHRGGGVLVLVEHDNVLENATFQNELLKRYGVEAEYHSCATHMESILSIWTWTSYSPWNLDRIQFFFPAPLLLHPNSLMQPMLKVTQPVDPKRAIIGARAKEGSKLKLIVLADAEMVWNGTKELGLSVGDNAEFMGRVMTELAGVPYSNKKPVHATSHIRSASVASTADHSTSQSPVTPLRALFLRDGEALIPDNQTIGLSEWHRFLKSNGYQVDIAYYNEVVSRRYDIVISVNPLAPLTVPQEWLERAGRVIVVVDGQSDFFNSAPEATQLIGDLFSKEVTAPTQIPANSLLKPGGLRFVATTLVDEQIGGQGLAVQLRDNNGGLRVIHRPSLITSEVGQKEFSGSTVLETTVLACALGAWPSGSLTPFITNGVAKPIFQVPEGYQQKECYPVVMQSGNTTAVGSLELSHDFNWLKKILASK